MKVDIGIFAHDEQDRIGPMLDGLFRQDAFAQPELSLRVHVLANGCRDATAKTARDAILRNRAQAGAIVHDLAEGGKSRTWNRFVHDLSRPDADFLVFMDADIRNPQPEVLRALLTFVAASPMLAGASSHAVKDIVHDPALAKGLLDRLIAAAGGTLNNWKDSICGQFYILRTQDARHVHMPIGLPVEDGFVRAMVQTRNFTLPGEAGRLDGREEIFHVYESERSIRALLRHQTRIVIGSAVNQVIYDRIRTQSPEDRDRDLAAAARDPDWLPAVLGDALPRSGYGYVPWSFLTKRIAFWRRSPDRLRPGRMLVTLLGFGFDAVVYLRAQYAMWRGVGAGYW